MKLSGASLRTLVICGAGATRGAIKPVRINKKRIKAPLNADFFTILEAFQRAHKEDDKTLVQRIDRLQEVIASDLPKTRGEKRQPTMEDVFSLLYVTQNLRSIFSKRKGPKRKSSKKGRKEIEDFLEVTCRLLADIQDAARGKTNRYDDLVHYLEDGDSIVTLNYDNLLDTALTKRGWKPSSGYGFKVSEKKLKWRPTDAGKLDVSLLKLHGSLNWFAKGSYSKPSAIFEKKPSLITDPSKVRGSSGHIRQIVPPVYGKTFAHSHWDSLWNAGFKEAQEAERLIIIGCSLVSTDFHLSGVLYKAIARRKKAGAPFKEVIIVNGRKKGKCRWRLLVRGCTEKDPRYYPTFENFCASQSSRR